MFANKQKMETTHVYNTWNRIPIINFKITRHNIAVIEINGVCCCSIMIMPNIVSLDGVKRLNYENGSYDPNKINTTGKASNYIDPKLIGELYPGFENYSITTLLLRHVCSFVDYHYRLPMKLACVDTNPKTALVYHRCGFDLNEHTALACANLRNQSLEEFLYDFYDNCKILMATLEEHNLMGQCGYNAQMYRLAN
ncbi:putative ORFan [Tupanvirus deep ocean]|uniref:ORFan n=2 Tax=Tupanvirus TaxID=2094720 RepID=A0AC62A9J2_9VIRU|nr:putative ORFan [Tupanvirus deep ocean]QKU34439.1 putative ORFan [Tupanvirus deep ocean]